MSETKGVGNRRNILRSRVLPRVSIGVRFISLVLLVTMLSGGSVSFIYVAISRDALRREVLNKLLAQADLVADFASVYMAAVQAHIRVFADRPDVRQALLNGTSEQFQTTLTRFVATQTALETAGLYDTEGTQLANGYADATLVGQSFAGRTWFQQMMATGQPHQGTPAISRVTGHLLWIKNLSRQDLVYWSLQQKTSTPPRIKIDVTKHEILFEPPELRDVHHPYSDATSPPIQVKCYNLTEILAEKTRAIMERKGRARDVYDVVNLGRHFKDEIVPSRVRATLVAKFEYKGLPVPTINALLTAIDEESLSSNWGAQLSHQMPLLPPVESYIEGLKTDALWWMESDSPEISLPIVSFPEDERVKRDRFPTFRLGGENDTDLTGRITFAARNRLCIEIRYHGAMRVVEPYSLRNPRTGNVLFYAFEIQRGGMNTGQIKAYKVNEIDAVHIINATYQPRWVVEL
jgi:hypothetical protein